MLVMAVIPCRGRKDKTLEVIERLKYTDNIPFRIVTVSGQEDRDIVEATKSLGAEGIISYKPKLSYWEALQLATDTITSEPIIANLSNDLKPANNWLRNALVAYDKKIGRTNFGIVGFNGDGHGTGDSCHFLIHRELLKRYGGWPVWYNHNYGDAELCERANADRVFFKEPYAILFHDHPYFRGEEYDDEVYKEGRKKLKQDEELYLKRKAANWPNFNNL